MEPLDLPFNRLLPSIEVRPILELNKLLNHLRYTFLGLNDTLPIIMSSKLTILQEENLIRILKDHKSTIAWTIADIKGIWCGCWSFSPGQKFFPHGAIEIRAEQGDRSFKVNGCRLKHYYEGEQL